MQEKEDSKATYLSKGSPMCDTVAGCAARQSAQGVLRDQAERQSKRTEALETLVRVIPWHLLSPRDEETLWRYFTERH